MNDCGEKEEIVRRTIVRRFDIAVGRCRECQRRVQGRHPLQTSDAVGVGSVQLGPEALTLAAILNKQMGLSLGHTRQVLSYGFGLEVSRGGLYRALARMADRAEPTYDGLVETARQAPVNGMDETGWKVGGRLQWLHVAVSAQVTVYAILPGRGYEQSVAILGAEYDGFLIHDGWAPYYRFQFAFHQSCLAHLLKRCREMAQIASPAALAFPRAVEDLLRTSLELRDRYEQGEISERGLSDRHRESWKPSWTGCWKHAAGTRRTIGWRAISNMNGSGCSPSCTVPVWMPPTTRPNEPSAAW